MTPVRAVRWRITLVDLQKWWLTPILLGVLLLGPLLIFMLEGDPTATAMHPLRNISVLESWFYPLFVVGVLLLVTSILVAPARRRITPADLLLSIAAGGLMLSFVSMLGKSLQDWNWSYRLQHFVAAVCFGLLLAGVEVASRRRDEMRRRVAMLVVASVVAGAGVELALRWMSVDSDTHVRAAERAGVVFDDRTNFQVVMDARAAGEDMTFSVHPFNFLGQPLYVDGIPTVPLGGVASTPTVLCNESGSHTTFISDEFGFHNPPIGWTQLPELEVVVVGDSLAQGSCVADGDGFVAILQRMFPRTVNLARSGNGPLVQLATIREYLNEGNDGNDGTIQRYRARARRKVRFVVWPYFERNDLLDLTRERDDPLLLKYLVRGFSQGLSERQSEIDDALNAFVELGLRKDQESQTEQETRVDVNYNVLSLLPNTKQLLLRAWAVYEERLPFGRQRAEGEMLDLYTRRYEQPGASCFFCTFPSSAGMGVG